MTPKALIYTELSHETGMGHATRCRALAHALAARGAAVQFLTETPALEAFVAPFPCALGVLAFDIPAPDIYIVDTKTDISEDWYRVYRGAFGSTMVRIDHPSAAPDTCDLLILPGAHHAPATLARLGHAFGNRLLAGWDYVMLDDEVTSQPPIPYAEREQGPIVFCAGGSDPAHVLHTLYTWTATVLPDVHKIYAYGAYAAVLKSPSRLVGPCEIRPFSRDLLRTAALVVGFLGQMTYECLWYRTPMLCFAREPEDVARLEVLVDAVPHVIPCGLFAHWTAQRFRDLLAFQYPWCAAVNACILDGHGVHRIATAILELY